MPLRLRGVQGAYDVSQHPGVVSKRLTEEEVMEDFISTFEGEIKDGKVCVGRAVGSCEDSWDERDRVVLRRRSTLSYNICGWMVMKALRRWCWCSLRPSSSVSRRGTRRGLPHGEFHGFLAFPGDIMTVADDTGRP